MSEIDETAHLKDLKTFRWELYHYRNSKEIIKCLSRYYFKKYYFKYFAEEIIIAGYDLQNLNKDIRTEVYLHVPYLSYDEFPSIRQREHQIWDLNRLFICLIYGNELCFTRGLELIAEKRPNDLNKVFVCIAFLFWKLEGWLSPSIRQTFESVIEKPRSSQTIPSSVIDVVNNYKNHFEYWKGKRYRNIVEVIDAVLPEPTFRYKKLIEHFDRDECLDILIDYDVNVTTALHCDRTALSHAVEHNNIKAILKLLNKGSFVGSATALFDPSLCNIDYKILRKYFDSCINKCIEDERFIEIDLKNLISPSKECESCDGSCFDEMKAIEVMSNSKEYQHLLIHPLISTFVTFKWNRIALMLYIDFILYTFATLSITGYILFIDCIGTPDWAMITLTVQTIILTVYLAIRGALRQIFSSIYEEHTRKNTLRNLMLCMHITLIVALVVAILLEFANEYRPMCGAVCILLMVIELFVLAGSIFWSFSKYYVMFLDVATSSLKSLQLCVILFPAFSVSFYLLMRDQPPKIDNLIIDTDGVAEDNLFNDLSSSFIKILAMANGEFEGAQSNFEDGIMSWYLFVVFLFLVTIVFMNLMNGLAVSDTQKIQSDAETTSMIQRVRVLAYYTRIQSNRHHWFCKKFHNTWFMKFYEHCSSINSLKILCHPLNTKIYVSQDNKVLILKKDWKTSEQDSIIFDQNGTYLYDWASHFSLSNKVFRIHRHIVEHIRKILERRDTEQYKEHKKYQLKNHIVKLENDIGKIMQTIQMFQQGERNIVNQLNLITDRLNDVSNDIKNVKNDIKTDSMV